ncbi:MAG: hypothetical protein EOO74_00765 [Myxococcales bacterium]|nr:MAG: hypothetical protein EOO74_00765 [Myxococcales bacterium]
MTWLDAIGWVGSALLIYSVMQARVLRFRVLNLAACVVLTGFNAALGIWPMVAMNIALCAINLWHIRNLVQTRDDDATYEVLEVGPQDEYLRHVLRVHGSDILRFQPDLVWDGAREGAAAFLVQRGDETVGMVLLHEADGVAHVLLDYVTPRFRDFSPGKFVWRRSNVLRDKGYSEIRTPATMVNPYYERLGFRPGGDGSWILDLQASG